MPSPRRPLNRRTPCIAPRRGRRPRRRGAKRNKCPWGTARPLNATTPSPVIARPVRRLVVAIRPPHLLIRIATSGFALLAMTEYVVGADDSVRPPVTPTHFSRTFRRALNANVPSPAPLSPPTTKPARLPPKPRWSILILCSARGHPKNPPISGGRSSVSGGWSLPTSSSSGESGILALFPFSPRNPP